MRRPHGVGANLLNIDKRKGNVMISLQNKIRRFIKVEDGLVTVEWVALTAGMVVAAVAVGFIVMQTTYGEANKVGNNVIGTNNSIYGPKGSNLAP
jgi:UDP-N-acetylenolpyruvoylglucosamine reductase